MELPVDQVGFCLLEGVVLAVRTHLLELCSPTMEIMAVCTVGVAGLTSSAALAAVAAAVCATPITSLSRRALPTQ